MRHTKFSSPDLTRVAKFFIIFAAFQGFHGGVGINIQSKRGAWQTVPCSSLLLLYAIQKILYGIQKKLYGVQVWLMYDIRENLNGIQENFYSFKVWLLRGIQLILFGNHEILNGIRKTKQQKLFSACFCCFCYVSKWMISNWPQRSIFADRKAYYCAITVNAKKSPWFYFCK